ncbi:hypothetical protein MJO29_015391 [Puccinia striiformis f. sp. tritici]|nr:hypothetical protein MJO29_015391 [Puccinia striiformis f. sp. tritici]KAI9630205.1 hypothetical protein KEM48_012238 [Puccinia striiformis f. sp. tritici PST-130]
MAKTGILRCPRRLLPPPARGRLRAVKFMVLETHIRERMSDLSHYPSLLRVAHFFRKMKPRLPSTEPTKVQRQQLFFFVILSIFSGDQYILRRPLNTMF